MKTRPSSTQNNDTGYVHALGADILLTRTRRTKIASRTSNPNSDTTWAVTAARTIGRDGRADRAEGRQWTAEAAKKGQSKAQT